MGAGAAATAAAFASLSSVSGSSAEPPSVIVNLQLARLVALGRRAQNVRPGVDRAPNAERGAVDGVLVENDLRIGDVDPTGRLHGDRHGADLGRDGVDFLLRVVERALERVGRARGEALANDAVVRLLRLDVLAFGGERAREPEHERGRVHHLVGAPEAVLGRGVVLVLEGLLTFLPERACGRAIGVRLGARLWRGGNADGDGKSQRYSSRG